MRYRWPPVPPSDAPLDSGALYGALTALRAGTDVARAWRTIDRWMKSRFPAAKDDDARQAALLSVHRSVATMEASDPAGAAAWVRTIVQRKKIDLSRRDKRRRALSLVGSEGEDLEIEGSASVTLSEGHLEGILLELEGALDRLLEERHPEPRQRIMPRAHARARLFRALGHGVAEVRELLGWTEPLSDAVISKWIERGLPVLSDAIDRWIDEAPSARTELGERLLERVELRRGAVGKPRHARRKTSTSPKGEGLSVAPRGGRRTERRRCAMPASSKFPVARSKRSMGILLGGLFGWERAALGRGRRRR